MSVDNYTYRCLRCGHIERQCEGIYLLSDECYTMLQCPQCKRVDSIALTEDAMKALDYPPCPVCNVKMAGWNGTCPECGSAMIVTGCVTDTI